MWMSWLQAEPELRDAERLAAVIVMSPMRTIQDVLERLRIEFLEIPDPWDPSRCNVCAVWSGRFARIALDLLVDETFLYVKWTDTTHASWSVIICISRSQTSETDKRKKGFVTLSERDGSCFRKSADCSG
jgi:hypothetical protein